MVSLSRGKCSHANESQIWKATDGGDAVGVAIFPMPKNAGKSWWNSKLRLREVFCALGTNPPVTERNSYGLGYHNRQLDSRNKSFPICNRNKNI